MTVAFITGLFIGTLIGVFIMCVIQMAGTSEEAAARHRPPQKGDGST